MNIQLVIGRKEGKLEWLSNIRCPYRIYNKGLKDIAKELDIYKGNSKLKKSELIKTKLENETLKEKIIFYKEQLESQLSLQKDAHKANNEALIESVKNRPDIQINK